MKAAAKFTEKDTITDKSFLSLQIDAFRGTFFDKDSYVVSLSGTCFVDRQYTRMAITSQKICQFSGAKTFSFSLR